MNDKLHHKLGAGLALAAVLLALFGASHLVGRWAMRAAPEVVHKTGPILGYAPPPPPGAMYTSPNGNQTSEFGVMNPMCTGGELIRGYQCVDAGANVLVTNIANNVANKEGVAVDVMAQVIADGGPGVGSGNCTRRFHGFDNAGTFQTSAGATTDTSVTSDWGGSFADAGCGIVVDAGAAGQLMSLGLTLSTGTNSGGACVYWGLSSQRCLSPSWGPSLTVDAVTPSSFSTTVASNTPISLQGTHDIQPATATSFVLSNNSNSYTLPAPAPCTVTDAGVSSTNCVTSTVNAGSYAAGTYNTVLTTAAGTFTLTNAVTFTSVAAPVITSVVPYLANTGDTLTVTGTFTGATTGNTTATVCGNAATILSINSTTALLVNPTNTPSGTACNVVLTNPGGTSTGGTGAFCQVHAGILYNWDTTTGIVGSSPVTGLTDYESAKNMTVGGSQSAPTITSNYNGSGRTALSFASGTQGLSVASISATSQPLTYCWVGDANPGSGAFSQLMGQDAISTSLYLYIQNNAGTPQIFLQGGSSAFVQLNSQAITSPSMVCGVANNASSAVYVYNGTLTSVTGTAGTDGITTSPLFAIGSDHAGAHSLAGHVAEALAFNVALASGDVTIVHSCLCTNRGLCP